MRTEFLQFFKICLASFHAFPSSLKKRSRRASAPQHHNPMLSIAVTRAAMRKASTVQGCEWRSEDPRIEAKYFENACAILQMLNAKARHVT